MRTQDEVSDPRLPLQDAIPIVIRVVDHEFQKEVLEKLGRLEANMEMLVGDGQPGRVKAVEDKISVLERHEVGRGVYDKIVNAVIATIVSTVIALHDHFGIR